MNSSRQKKGANQNSPVNKVLAWAGSTSKFNDRGQKKQPVETKQQKVTSLSGKCPTPLPVQ